MVILGAEKWTAKWTNEQRMGGGGVMGRHTVATGQGELRLLAQEGFRLAWVQPPAGGTHDCS